ncbi:hypothetical protein VPHD274_0024 [Vibrio phage D274]
MKYLITLLLAFSFNALAITQSFTLDTGVTHSSYVGSSNGVVEHFSKDYSKSNQGNMKSEKLDRISGSKSESATFGGTSTGHYAGAYSNMNGADFSYKQTSTTYSDSSFTATTDRFTKDGFERNTKHENGGTSVEHSTYAGDFLTYKYGQESTSGTATTTATSWY